MSKIGTVCRWDEDRGFGFIGQDGGQADIFVHRTCLQGVNLLEVGDKVSYDAIYDDRKQKFQAITCTILEPANSSTGSMNSPNDGFNNQFMQPMQPVTVMNNQFIPAPLPPSPTISSPSGWMAVNQPMAYNNQTPPNQGGQFQLFPPQMQPMFATSPMNVARPSQISMITVPMHDNNSPQTDIQSSSTGSVDMARTISQQSQPAGLPFW